MQSRRLQSPSRCLATPVAQTKTLNTIERVYFIVYQICECGKINYFGPVSPTPAMLASFAVTMEETELKTPCQTE